MVNKINPKTTKTFVWAASIIFLLGMMIMSPTGSFFLYSVAALFAVIPTIFGAKKTRIVAVVILAVSIALLVATYPKFSAEMTKYRERVNKKSSEVSTPKQEHRQEERR